MFGPSNPDEAATSAEGDSPLAKAASYSDFTAMGLKINPAACALDLLSKAEQLGLFAVPVQVAGSVDKHGTVRKPHVRIQKVRAKEDRKSVV